MKGSFDEYLMNHGVVQITNKCATFESINTVSSPGIIGNQDWPNLKLFLAPGAQVTFTANNNFLGYDVSGQSYKNTSDYKMELVFQEDLGGFELLPIGDVLDIA
jgi:hypothetical protein